MKSKTEPAALDAHLGFWLRFVSNHVSHAFGRKVEAHRVTVAEWVVLRRLFGSGSIPPSALADDLGMTRGAISKLVERLVGKELVGRTAEGKDKRFQSLSLTDAGGKLVPTLAALADENDKEFFGHLGDEQKLVFTNLLKELVRRNGWKHAPID